jgi:hypothetical protein
MRPCGRPLPRALPVPPHPSAEVSFALQRQCSVPVVFIVTAVGFGGLVSNSRQHLTWESEHPDPSMGQHCQPDFTFASTSPTGGVGRREAGMQLTTSPAMMQ